MDLIFTPVVTLHNPYNVNISFYNMEVEFHQYSGRLQFHAASQVAPGPVRWVQKRGSGTFDSLNTMAQIPNNRGDKKFVMNIADWSRRQTRLTTPPPTSSGPIVMKPGQTLVCGPNPTSQAASFYKDARAGNRR